MRQFIRAFNFNLHRCCGWGAVSFLAAMVLLMILQVLARYFLRAAPVWTEEAARYCMIWGGLLGATLAFYRDEDPKLLQPPKHGPRLWIGMATGLRAMAVIIFMGPILYHSYHFLARHRHRTADALGISTFWVTIAVPFAVAVILVHLIARLTGRDSIKIDELHGEKT